jgi:cathepsin B
VILSPQDMVSCDTTDSGCNGGNIDNAWNYLANTGAVLDTCFPYTSGKLGVSGKCPNPKACTGTGSWTKYKCQAGSIVIPKTATDIQYQLENFGPLGTRFDVYSDFMNYGSGIYTHVSGTFQGGHAVKIVGWGTDASLGLYWIVANSWNTSWGEQGFFRIQHGQVGIDVQPHGCTPATSAADLFLQ